MEPIIIKKKIGTQNSRTSRLGLNPFHVCPMCSYQSPIKSRTIKHMIACQKQSLDKKKIINQDHESNPNKNEQVSIRQSDQEEPEHTQNKITPLFSSRLSDLEQEVEKLKQGISQSNQQPSIYKLATEIYKMSSGAIEDLIISKISEALSQSLQSKEQINKKKFQITTGLISRFHEMDFSTLINTFAQKLQRYYKNVQKENEYRDLTRAVVLGYEKAYKFFSQFQEIDMLLQVSVIQKIISLGPYRKRVILSFYSKMINDHPKLFPYQPFPKFIKRNKTRLRRQYYEVSFQQVKDVAQEMFQISPQLAVDLWMIVCMGLRKHDTLRIFFKIPETDTFAGYVKLIERKNQHDCVRVIPSSLITLIKLTNVTYPITKQRYRTVQKFSIDKFGRFYSLRGVCLTTIFTSFFKSDALAQTHKNVNVSMKHYVNFNSRAMIDSAFSLHNLPEIELNVAEDIVLDFDRGSQVPTIINYKTKKIEFFHMNKADVVNQLEEIQQESSDQTGNNQLLLQECPPYHRKAKQKARRKIQENCELTLRLFEPNCPKCRKGKLGSVFCQKFPHMTLCCQNCQQQVHTCSQLKYHNSSYLKKQQISITPTQYSEIQPVLLPLEYSNENNLKDMITSQGYTYIQDTIYLDSTPRHFACSYQPLDLDTSMMILENRLNEEYLPLLIKKSSIQDAGLGVFSSSQIQKNSLICSYIGEIGLGSKINLMKNGQNNDSLYLLGHLGLESLNIVPCQFSNVGRFINHNTKKYSNCSPHVALLQYQEDRYEICVFIKTLRDIKPGEQLFYSYGKQYLFEQEMNQQKCD